MRFSVLHRLCGVCPRVTRELVEKPPKTSSIEIIRQNEAISITLPDPISFITKHLKSPLVFPDCTHRSLFSILSVDKGCHFPAGLHLIA